MTAANHPTPHTSPFDPLFADTPNFPPAFRAQFLHSVDHPSHTMLNGTMDTIWHKPRWLWPFLWLSTFANILFPETGSHIPATMVVLGQRDPQHQPIQHWNRTFYFATPRYFNAIMAYDPQRKCIVEWFGQPRFLQIVWAITFQPPATITICTTGCNLMLGNFRLPLSHWFYPQVNAIETALANDVIHIKLEAAHPLTGPFFGYEGQFNLSVTLEENHTGI